VKITVIGTGWVGLTTAAVFAFLGNDVIGYDVNEKLIGQLRAGRVPFFEPHLEELTREGLACRRLSFTTDIGAALSTAEIIFLAVGTPPTSDGRGVEMSFVSRAATVIGENLRPGKLRVVVNKSTVPVGSNGWVDSFIRQGLAQQGDAGPVDFVVASNPEFLREGSAIADTFYPDRVVIGATDARAIEALTRLYHPILMQDFTPPFFLPRPAGRGKVPLVVVDPVTAELIKYAANAFLSTKISFINEIANLCDFVGANVKDVARGIGLDHRIGEAFLNAGIGWGGSCFPKDVIALIREAEAYGYEAKLLKATYEVNAAQRFVVIRKLQEVLKTVRGKTIGILGLAFKPNTDDLRGAPALDIIRKLGELGAIVRAYDPVAMHRCRAEAPDLPASYANDIYNLATGADALVLVTEWEEFTQANWVDIARLMRTPVVIDGRNALNKKYLEGLGFVYRGVGV